MSKGLAEVFDATAEFICMNPACERVHTPVTVGLRQLGPGVWELPSPRCQCNLHAQMRMVSLAGNPVD